MKRIGTIAFAALLFCGTASAQGPNNIVAALLGPTGPVQGLVQSLQQTSFEPLIDGLVHRQTGLIQGGIAEPLNRVLSGLLVTQEPIDVINGLSATVRSTLRSVSAGVADKGLDRILLGPNALIQVPLTAEAGEGIGAKLLASLPELNLDNITRPLVGGLIFGSGMITGGGQGLSPEQLRLNDINPAAKAALLNSVKLPGL